MPVKLLLGFDAPSDGDYERLSWGGGPILLDPAACVDKYELPRRACSVLETLSAKCHAVFELRLERVDPDKTRTRPAQAFCDMAARDFTVSVNIYGPRHAVDSVGLFLQKCGLYLQVPSPCRLDLPYINPHCLPAVDTNEKIITSAAFNGKSTSNMPRTNNDQLAMLDRLAGSDEQFPEEQQPEMVQTPLRRLVP